MTSQETSISSSGTGTRKTRSGLSKLTKATISEADDKDNNMIDSDGSTYDDSDYTESDDDFAGEMSEVDRSHGGPTYKKRKIESIGERMGKPSFSNLLITPKKAKGFLTPDPTPAKATDEAEDRLAAGLFEDEEDEQNKPYTTGAIYNDRYKCQDGIARKSAPLHTVNQMFDHMTDKALTLGFNAALEFLSNVPLRICTMCSGTEAPVLSCDMIKQRLQNLGHQKILHIFHAYSAEIVPFKQEYIQRNFAPPVIFRDITELSKPLDPDGKRRATTAHGGKAEVPGKIDILIAGFCCVDFSSLNNRQKSLEDLGESGDTFFAMLAYANEARPTTIILENVLNAPWEHKKGKRQEKGDSKEISITSHLESIGYSCVFLKADTKDFYLPHTRQRGYMVCIDNTLPNISEKVDALLYQCKNIFNKLKCPASVPVEAMLLRADDPRLRSGANESNGVSRQKIEWAKCRAGHEDYRRQLGLGNKREMTHWRPDGAVRNPDYFIPFSGQKERVSDIIEIAHLRNLVRGFDDRYYSRNLEASQNVYRVTDVTKLGIIGCLTPTGLPFNTVRGGKITGYESMILQGIPVENLDLNVLTQTQLQDLAGNAMSTTVVGAALLATLTTFNNFFDINHREKVAEEVIVPELVGEEELVPETTSNPAAYYDIPCSKLMNLGSSSTWLCPCEGRHDLHNSQFQRCKVCGHTTCLDHGKNPKHDYEGIESWFTSSRQNPDDFKALLKESLPSTIGFSKSFKPDDYLAKFRKEYALTQDDNTMRIAVEAIKAALKSELSFVDAIRSEVWEIQFESPAANLVLTISSSSIQWLLYAKPPQELSGNHPVRTLLEKFPIARLYPSGESITHGPWSFWVPEVRVFQATITSNGGLENAFLSDRGLDSHVGSSVYRKCSIEIEDFNSRFFEVDIRGDYELSQPCGQAFNSLHRKMPKEYPPIFFYFEHEGQTGDTDDHSFIFTRCKRRLHYAQNRPIIARVHESWRQSLIYDHSIIPEEDRVPTTISVDGYWQEFDDFSFALRVEHYVTYRHLPKEVSALQLPSCDSQRAVLACKYNLEGSNTSFPREKWIELGRTNKAEFFRSLGWIIEKCKVLCGHHLNDIHEMDAWHPSNDDNMCRCTDCAPREPSIYWSSQKKAAGTTGRKVLRQTPFEDPEEATVYEQKLKSRPIPISTLFRIGGNGDLEVKIGFNPSTLCHRALALLQPEGPSTGIQLSWWFATDDVKSSTQRLESFKLQSTANEDLASQPPELSAQCILRPEQLRKLTWMQTQEDGILFTEREIVEHRVQELGYLLMGQASQERRVRGGILADEVGFGKTIVILALILTRLKIDEKLAETPVPGLIPTKASIIFVPAQLPQQWKEEAQKFIANTTKGQILVIERIGDLEKLTIEDFKNALVIIVSCNLCETEKYQLALAHLGGMVESVKKASPRAKAAWYKAVRQQLGGNVDELMEHPDTFGDHLHAQFQKSIAASRSKTLPIPSKRVRGAEYLKVDKKRKFDEVEDSDDEGCEHLEPRPDNHNISNLKSEGYKKLLFPVFEMFQFTRVVVDEFTYIDFAHSITMLNVSAAAYWALSGTPPLDGFPDIKHMAQFLRINLGVHDFASMKRDLYTRITSDMTVSEKILTFQPKPSQSRLKLRHAQADRFLNSFVRRDVPILTLKACEEVIKLVRQTPLESALYSEIEQRVEPNNFKLTATHSKADMENYINDVLDGTGSGRMALLLRASYLSLLGAIGGKPQDAWTAFNAVLNVRQGQFDALLKEWSRLLDIAIWLHHQPANRSSSALKDYLAGVQNNILGDLDVTAKCGAVANIAIHEYHPDNVRAFRYATAKPSAALKKIRIDLGKISQELVDCKRPLRFFESIRRIERGSTQCDCCKNASSEPWDFVVLSSCGHLLCTATSSHAQEGNCPIAYCTSQYQSYQMIPGHRLAGDLLGKRHSAKGEKLRRIVHLINEEIPEDEQVLVFVQSSELRQKVVDAFKESDITFTDLKSTGMLSTQLTKFQHSKGKKNKVLILNIGDASASGSNLTMANHIIFVAPYLTSGSSAQQLYDAARTQAKGRAYRFGQKKDVLVYDFVTEHTIDVDIIEYRSGQLIKEYEEGTDPAEVKIGHRLEDAQDDESSIFGSRLAHKIFSNDEED